MYKCKKQTKKRRRKQKISKAASISIKREISYLKLKEEKINCSKLKENLGLEVSISTVQRHMHTLNLKYKNACHKIVLSQKHKERRIEFISEWISKNHDQEKGIFSDEKIFSLNGPDCWRMYVQSNSKYTRNKRQCQGSGIMVYLMVLPNGFFSFHMIKGNFKSFDYIALLDKFAVPVMKVNVESKFYLQEDNCTVHQAKDVKNYLKSKIISTITLP